MSGENYLSPDNIEEKAVQWLSELPYTRRWKSEIKWEESALLVIDMQNHFLSPESHAYLPAADAIIDNVNQMVRLFSENWAKVVYTRTVQDGPEGLMIEWWGNRIEEGDMARLDRRIVVNGDIVVKQTYSSFYETNIEDSLAGVKNIFIMGVMSDICCETTARDGFVRGYRVFFLADGTATSCEDIHTSTLRSLSHGIAEILLCKDVEERFV